jgi:hypothetical protein
LREELGGKSKRAAFSVGEILLELIDGEVDGSDSLVLLLGLSVERADLGGELLHLGLEARARCVSAEKLGLKSVVLLRQGSKLCSLALELAAGSLA